MHTRLTWPISELSGFRMSGVGRKTPTWPAPSHARTTVFVAGKVKLGNSFT